MNNTKVAKVERYVTTDGKEWSEEHRAIVHQQFLDICAEFKQQGMGIGGGQHTGSAVYEAITQILHYYDVTLKPVYQKVVKP